MDYSGTSFLNEIRHRRSVRDFSQDKVPKEIILRCIEAAGQAPSGANTQPWYFVLVEDPEVRKRLRREAEAVEKEFYQERISERWKRDLEIMRTDSHKPYLTDASSLIVIFSRRSTKDEASYYPLESTGIATGFLLAALHLARVSTLTHTPNPMSFLNEVLDVPPHFRPYMIVVAGYPKKDAYYPPLERKALKEYSKIIV